MRETLIAQYVGPVPRYTSYPTAPHFHDGITQATYADWLSAVPHDMRISLYIHIPFCDRLCWFCGCTTKQTKQYTPIARYLDILRKEIALVAEKLNGHGQVSSLHFGGGSPSMLSPDDLRWLNANLRRFFSFTSDAEISFEIDPNDMNTARHAALAAIGVTRASLGVQDFDSKVQQAINRPQTFEQTKAVVDGVRANGVKSVNLDVLYGLPHQTEKTIARTIAQVIALKPQRVALFGYAHVPWMKKHQRLIDEASLPDVSERFAQQALAAKALVAAGYQAIGIDHFALWDDSLAIADRKGSLRRNFQGYTADGAEMLIGLGASSIGMGPAGFVQNAPDTSGYSALVDKGELPIIKGIALTADDRIRGHIIEELMCRYTFSGRDLIARFGMDAEPLLAEAAQLVKAEPNGFFISVDDAFVIPPDGRPFVRSLAAKFDAYLGRGNARHSIAV